MKYQTKATPIATEAEFDAAKAAGARIEFTPCGPGNGFLGDTYDMPPANRCGSGSWISLQPWEPWEPLRAGEIVRAFYPITGTEGPEA